MKQVLKFLIVLVAGLAMMSPAASVVVQAFTESPFLTIAAIGAVFAVAKMTKLPAFHGVKNGVEVEVWSNWIADNVFKGYEWLQNCYRADEMVLKGKVVHIPQAGTKPVVVKNRTSLPAAAIKRTDTDVIYALDEYTTDPVVIEDAANVQLSYDKMSSVLGDHTGVLTEVAGDNISIAWAPSTASHIIRTTGSNYAAHMPAATGTRKGLTAADLKNASKALSKQKVPKQDRYAVMSEDMWAQMEDDLKATANRDYSRYEDAANGVIAKLYTFNIVVVPNMPVYDNAGTPVKKAYGAAGAISDNEMVLCYQKNCLELALGDIKFFENSQDPTYYGDVYSGLVRMGGRIRYSDETGVMAIVQTP